MEWESLSEEEMLFSSSYSSPFKCSILTSQCMQQNHPTLLPSSLPTSFFPSLPAYPNVTTGLEGTTIFFS